MKRFTKALAILLTFCLLCGAIAIISSAKAPAEKTTNTVNDKTFNYTFDEDEVGKSYNNEFPSGTGDASTCSSVMVVQGADGNKYVSYAYVKDATNKAYRRDLLYAVKNDTILNDYSYLTVDFDIAADKYAIQVGYKVKRAVSGNNYTYTIQPDWYLCDESFTQAEIEEAIVASTAAFKTQLTNTVQLFVDGVSGKTLIGAANGNLPAISANTNVDEYIAALEAIDYAKALETKRLSYSNGAYFCADNRYKTSADGDYIGGGYAKFYVYIVYDQENKVWNLCSGSNGSTVYAQLSNNIGEWNHFTLAIKMIEKEVELNGATTTTACDTFGQMFFNGQPIGSPTLLCSTYTSAGVTAKEQIMYINPRAFDFQIPDYTAEFSMGIDNFTSTWYAKDYTSGNAYGIDDLLVSASSKITTPIFECEDVVYDAEYKYPAPNDSTTYAQINGGKKMYVDDIIKYSVENARAASVVTTTRDILGLTPVSGTRFTVVCADGIEVTLSDAGKLTHNIIKTATGYEITSKNQLVLPTVGKGENLVYGTYASVDYENATSVSGTGWSGSHGFGVTGSNNAGYYLRMGADSIGTNPYNGNKYFNVRKYAGATLTNNNTGAYIEYSLSDWENKTGSIHKGNVVGRYDYSVVDFDFGSDAYQLHVGYRVVNYNATNKPEYVIEKAYKTYTPTEFSREAVEADIAATRTKLLADIETYNAKLTAEEIATYSVAEITYEQALSTKTLAYASGSNMYLGFRRYDNADDTSKADGPNLFLYIGQKDGKWAFFKDSSFKNLVCYLPENLYETVHITYVATMDHETKLLTALVFVNGVYANSTTNTGAEEYKCIDSVRLQMPADLKDEDAYSYIYDNITVNYYEKGYSSGSAYGIDDYAAAGDLTKPIYVCEDIVYNASYVSPNGYVQVDNGEKSYITPVINEMLGTIKDGSVIRTSKSLYNLTLDSSIKSITVITENGATVNLSAESAKSFIVETTDNVTYTVRAANESDAIKLEWYDSENNLIKTDSLLPNVLANTDAVNASIYNVATREVIYVLSWTWDLDGDGTYEPIGSFTLADNMGGKTVKAKPVVASTTIEKTYAIYTEENGVARLVGDASIYTNDLEFVSQVKNAPDGATVIIYQDVLYINYTSIIIGEGKTLSFNLNGNILYQYGTGNWDSPIFAASQGSTLNFYSSVPGAEVYQARWKNSEVGLTAYPGIFATVKGADDIVMNVGAYGDYSGDNISVYGATIFVPTCADNTFVESDSENITFNINGGYYYAILDSSYAMLKIAAPDVIYNVDGAHFYSKTAGIIWSDDRYNAENAHLYIYNSELYTASSDGTRREVVWKLHDKNSSIYFENCKMRGSIAEVASGNTIYIGPGNEIDASISSNAMKRIKFATLVDGEYVEDVAYAKSNNNAYLVNLSGFALPTLTVDGANGNKLTAESFRSAVAVDVVVNAYYVTYKKDAVPSNAKDVTWLDVDGTSIVTETWIVGSKPSAPKHSGATVKDNYFTKSYKWAKENGEDANEFLVSDTLNVFKPVAVYEAAKISGAKANMSLFTNMMFNLYLPKSDKIANLVITDENGGAIAFTESTAPGTAMYLVQWKQPVNSFDAKVIYVSFVVDGNELSTSISLDPITYATLVVNQFACGSEEAVLAYEIINYKAAIATFIDSTFENAKYDAFLAIFDSHENCICGATAADISEDEAAVDYSALDVQWVQYALSANKIGMIIKADASATVEVAYKNPMTGEFVELDVEYDTENQYFIVSAVEAAYINRIMYITVNGEEGTYCLGKFILNNPTIDVAKAIYSYSKAAADFKFVTADEK